MHQEIEKLISFGMYNNSENTKCVMKKQMVDSKFPDFSLTFQKSREIPGFP